MRIALALVALLFAATMVCATPRVPVPPKIRPYSGIGVLMVDTAGAGKTTEPYPLYDEPAIARLGELDLAKVPACEWIFGTSGTSLPLIVMARKGSWLRVVYDDAGREAWLDPRRPALYRPWELFLKGRSVRLLPGLQKRQYQSFQHPGKGPTAVVTPNQSFRVIKLESDWALVVSDRNTLGWLRWRDEDGRLLMGLANARP